VIDLHHLTHAPRRRGAHATGRSGPSRIATWHRPWQLGHSSTRALSNPATQQPGDPGIEDPTMNDGSTTTQTPIHPQVDIGHVHLNVADLDRAIAFYRDVLGFQVTGRIGDAVAFLAAGGDHHLLGLNAYESRGGEPPPPGTTGPYHVAIRYPNRAELARAVRRVLDHGVRIVGASDHGASEAVYLHDPDGNGIELTADRHPGARPRDERGALVPTRESLDLDDLLAELIPAPALAFCR
jgi:catechol 2,3-dioxygenase